MHTPHPSFLLLNDLKPMTKELKYIFLVYCEASFDLEVLINQMKKGLALSYQNLKDIGINSPGDRAKILT